MKRNSILSFFVLLILSAFAFATPDQPNMESARANLQNAKANLQVAEQNKGGHRAKALGLVNSAIAEVNRGIQFARRNNHAEAAFTPVLDQPHMEAALNFLKNAKSDLEKATGDKGGHRANALRMVNEAIDEVNLGIAAGRS